VHRDSVGWRLGDIAPMSAHDDFKIQVLRAFVALYRGHPRVIGLSSAQTHFPPPTRNEADFSDKVASSGGAVTWLHRNGYVTGEARPGSFMTSAQLSRGGHAIFRQFHPIEGRPLGDAAIEAVDDGDEARRSVLADLLMDRIA